MGNKEIELPRLTPGALSGDEERSAIRFLEDHWDQFTGSGDQATTFEKLHRAENLSWNPPVLSFVLERHGRTVNQSSRADLHYWEVDTSSWAARIVSQSHRQITPAAKQLDVKKLAREVATLIEANQEHKFLRWKGDNEVALNISEIIPETYKQTTIGRRKRFYVALEEVLQPSGWSKSVASTRIKIRPVDLKAIWPAVIGDEARNDTTEKIGDGSAASGSHALGIATPCCFAGSFSC